MRILSRKKKGVPAEGETESSAKGREKGSSAFLAVPDGQRDDRYLNLAVEKRNWQIAWRITAALLAVSIGFNGYYQMSSKFVPYVVAVDKLGTVIAVGPASKMNAVESKRVIREQVIRWVEWSRTVSGDQDAQKTFMRFVYARVESGGSAFRRIDTFYHDERKPFTTAAQYTVTANVTLALPVSDSTYQVEWTETKHAPNGDILSQERWKGLFTFKTVVLDKDEDIQRNGAGFFITDFSWSKVLG